MGFSFVPRSSTGVCPDLEREFHRGRLGWCLQIAERPLIVRQGERLAVIARGEIDGQRDLPNPAAFTSRRSTARFIVVGPPCPGTTGATFSIRSFCTATAWRAVRRRLRKNPGAAGALESPVPARHSFQQDVRLHQDEPIDLDPAKEQREQCDFNLEAAELHHVGAGSQEALANGILHHDSRRGRRCEDRDSPATSISRPRAGLSPLAYQASVLIDINRLDHDDSNDDQDGDESYR